MSNEFSGTGNAGEDPFLRQVTVGTKQHTIAVLRVFFPDYGPTLNGGFEQTGDGTVVIRTVLADIERGKVEAEGPHQRRSRAHVDLSHVPRTGLMERMFK